MFRKERSIDSEEPASLVKAATPLTPQPFFPVADGKLLHSLSPIDYGRVRKCSSRDCEARESQWKSSRETMRQPFEP